MKETRIDDQLVAVAKRIHNELRETEIPVHGAILAILDILLKHRMVLEQTKRAEEMHKAQLDQELHKKFAPSN